jgi:hypothetical protein
VARSFLRLTDSEFWDMAPKTLFCMIAEWQVIEDQKAMVQAIASNGQSLPHRTKPHDPDVEEDVYVHAEAW